MTKRQTKAIPKPFASEEINPNFEPTPIGEWAGGGAVTPSLDPEVLLENASQGITKMCIQPDGTKILPPASDIAALQYSNDYRITALQEHGIAEYSAVLDYHLNDITKLPNGSKIYRSLVNDNIGNSLTDTSKWDELDLLALKQATISQRGTLQIATISDINTGTDNTKALTIANLRASNINFTGTPTAPTQPTTDNSIKIATTEYVNNKIASEKKFGLNVSNSILLQSNTNFVAPDNGTVIFYAQFGTNGFAVIYIDGSSVGVFTNFASVSIPVAKGQSISFVPQSAGVIANAVRFYPFKS